MKTPISTIFEAVVRNPLEISGKGIVSYIPLPFLTKFPIFFRLSDQLPTAYFYFLNLLPENLFLWQNARGTHLQIRFSA